MATRLKALSAVAVLASVVAWARPGGETLCRGFLPDNDLQIPVGALHAGGLTRAEFDAVLDRVEKVYGPIVAAKGGQLVVDRRWDDATVNASATRSMNRWEIHMYGGLARHKSMTQDGFALVACHELGHHIGGAPKIGGLLNRWATNEGQSDYYGTLKCARRIFADAGSATFTRPVLADSLSETECAASFQDPTARALCQRSSQAGLSLATVLSMLKTGGKTPSFDTPDPSVVARTNHRHPAAQCRLDTYFQGALCGKPLAEDVDDRNAARGACTRSGGSKVGMRPLCWYKPPMGEFAPSEALASARPVKAGSVLASLESMALWQGN